MNRIDFLKALALGGVSWLTRDCAWADEPPEPKTFVYKTAGSCELRLDAYGSDPNIKKPMFVHIHGGALILGSRQGVPKWIPHGDYVVLSLEYRLAPETKLPGIIADVQDAFRWIREQGPRLLNINPDKIVVEGESAGGYLTLMTGFCIKPRPTALISVSGYGDIDRSWITQPSEHYNQQPRIPKEVANASVGSICTTQAPAERGKFYLYCRQNGIWPQAVTGHDPHREPGWFKRYCPVKNVSSKYPPTVLIHGTADTDVAYEASVEMDTALTQFHVPHKFITVPGGHHVLGGMPENEQKPIYHDALAFVKRYLV